MPADQSPPAGLDTLPLPDPFPGEYRLIRPLGAGAFGMVWLAEQLRLAGRPVALKTLKVPADSTYGPQVLAALQRDAAALAKVQHPNIVRVHDLRLSGGQPYLVLEYVAGGSLDDLLNAGGPLAWADAARYVADVGEALLEVHEAGIVHRDIKPANILLDAARGEARLTDFGVSSHLAEPGSTAGTPRYMAPEAWDGHVSPALDVFGLAATLFHLATGATPFPAGDATERHDQVARGLPDPDPRCGGLPEPLERVIRAGLAFDARRRPDARQFVEELRAALNHTAADALVPSSGPSTPGVDLRLVVSQEVSPGEYRPLSTSPPRPVSLTRDMKKVPPAPAQVRLRTGDRVRIEVVADREGYVTVFNIGPTGNLNLLYPDGPPAPAPPPVRPGQPLHVLDVELTTPAGRERLFAVWGRQPLRLEELETLADRPGGDVSRPHRATRDMKRVRAAVATLPPEEGKAVVLELDHLP